MSTAHCIPGLEFGSELVAFDDYGFIAIDRAGRSIELLRQDGQPVASVAEDDIVLGSSNKLLVIDHGTGANDETAFTVTDRDFAVPHRLNWAPSGDAGTPVVATAWSPSVAYPEIAFLTCNEDRYQLQIYDLEGRLNHAVDPGRIHLAELNRHVLSPMPRTCPSSAKLPPSPEV